LRLIPTLFGRVSPLARFGFCTSSRHPSTQTSSPRVSQRLYFRSFDPVLTFVVLPIRLRGSVSDSYIWSIAHSCRVEWLHVYTLCWVAVNRLWTSSCVVWAAHTYYVQST
jgi:hypothetical protein